MPALTIHRAAKEGNLERLKALIDAGSDLGQRNIYGRTPMELAVQHGQTKAVELLKRSGAKG